MTIDERIEAYRETIAATDGAENAAARADVLSNAHKFAEMVRGAAKGVVLPTVDEATDPTTGKAYRPLAYVVSQLLLDKATVKKLADMGFPIEFAELKAAASAIRGTARDRAYGRKATRTRKARPQSPDANCREVCKSINSALSLTVTNVKATAAFTSW